MADNNIGVNLELGGEKAFLAAIKSIDKEIRLFGDYVKDVTSELMGNEDSVKSLTEKNKYLTQEIEKQQEKCAELTKLYYLARDSIGAFSGKTVEYEDKVIRARTALNGMKSELQENIRKMEDLRREQEKQISRQTKLAESIGDLDRELKLLGSELSVVQSEYRRGETDAEGYRRQNALLNEELEAQRKRLSYLQDMLAELASSTDDVSDETQEYRLEINRTQENINRLTREIEDNERATEDLRREQEKQEYETRQANSLWFDATESAKEHFSALISGKSSFDLIVAAVKKVVESFKAYVKACMEASDEFVSMVKTGISKAKDFLSGVGNVVSAVGDKVKAAAEKVAGFIKGAFEGVSVAVGAAVASAGAAVKQINGMVGVYTEFDDALRTIAGIMGFTSDEIANNRAEYEKIKKTVIELGTQTRYTAAEAASALQSIALSGYGIDRTDEALEVLRGTLVLATDANMDLSEAGRMVVDTLSALNDESLTVNDYLDKLVITARNSDTNINELGEALRTVSGAASVSKQDVDQLSAALGVLANAGFQGEEGGNLLRNVLMRMYAPTDKVKKSFDNLGVSMYTSTGEARDLSEVLKDFSASIKDLSDEELAGILGEEFSTRQITGAVTLINHYEEIDRLLGIIQKDSKDAADALQETMDSGIGGSDRRFQNALYSAKTVIGEAFADIKKTILDDASGLLGDFVSEAMNGDGTQIQNVASAISSLLGKASVYISEKLPEIADIGFGIVSGIGKTLSDNAGVLVESFKSVFTKSMEMLGDGASFLSETMLPVALGAAEGFIDHIPDFVKTISESGSKFVSAFKENKDRIKTDINDLFESVLSLIDVPKIMSSASDLVVEIFDTLPDTVKNMSGSFGKIISDIFDAMIALVDKAPDIITKLGEGLTKLLLKVGEKIPEIVDHLIPVANNLISAFTDLVVNVVPNVMPQINDSIDKIVTEIGPKLTEALIKLDKPISDAITGIFSTLEGNEEIINHIVYSVYNIAAKVRSKISGFDLIFGADVQEQSRVSKFQAFFEETIPAFLKSLYTPYSLPSVPQSGSEKVEIDVNVNVSGTIDSEAEQEIADAVTRSVRRNSRLSSVPSIPYR